MPSSLRGKYLWYHLEDIGLLPRKVVDNIQNMRIFFRKLSFLRAMKVKSDSIFMSDIYSTAQEA